MARKEGIIGSWEERLSSLKQELMKEKSKPAGKTAEQRVTIPPSQVDNYLINIV